MGRSLTMSPRRWDSCFTRVLRRGRTNVRNWNAYAVMSPDQGAAKAAVAAGHWAGGFAPNSAHRARVTGLKRGKRNKGVEAVENLR